MDERLRDHRPSASARRRAASAGIDLAMLKLERPDEYRMLNASEAVRVAPPLVDELAGALALAFPDHSFYRAPAGPLERILAFPRFAETDRARLDALVTEHLDLPRWRARHASYREVKDGHGARREVILPTAPSAYEGGEAWVGPFESREQADGWAQATLLQPLVHDVMARSGGWYCDVFSGQGPDTDGPSTHGPGTHGGPGTDGPDTDG